MSPLPADLRQLLHNGTVIPAHPLALRDDGRLDETSQRALTRYYLAAGAGGLAVGVHTTQFAIREQGLLEPVLTLAAQTARAIATTRPVLLVAGVCGETPQAVAEAALARDRGYHAGLLSLAALREADDDALIEHARAVAEVIPLIGFYLQPAVGGRALSRAFWRRFFEIENVVAVKIAPFDRYKTLDVLRALADSQRAGEVALYTGNDDNILLDLLTRFQLGEPGGTTTLRIVGGLLGHWAVWTARAVEQLAMIHQLTHARAAIPDQVPTLAAQVTESNAALFDAAHDFAGCIAGLHHVLAGQGIMRSTRCLDPNETLSPGQAEEIERIRRVYPHLTDDDFVREHVDSWRR